MRFYAYVRNAVNRRVVIRCTELKPVHRPRAGQAVVQFVVDNRDRSEYAVKFFLDREAFLTEAALYAACFPAIHCTTSPSITARANATREYFSGGLTVVETVKAAARFLPQVEAVCDELASGLEDPRGHPLPPCIVMEKGESLQDWSDRAEPDLFTSLAVCLLDTISWKLRLWIYTNSDHLRCYRYAVQHLIVHSGLD